MLSLAACAPTVQPTQRQEAPQATREQVLPRERFLPEGYDLVASCKSLIINDSGKLEMTAVGLFPKADQSLKMEAPYRFKCPNFEVLSYRAGAVLIQGRTMDDLRDPLIEALAYYYGRFDIFERGIIQVRDRSTFYLTSAVIQNSKSSPLYYKGQSYVVPYDANEQVIIRSNSYARWPRIEIDWNSNIVVLKKHGGLED